MSESGIENEPPYKREECFSDDIPDVPTWGWVVIYALCVAAVLADTLVWRAN